MARGWRDRGRGSEGKLGLQGVEDTLDESEHGLETWEKGEAILLEPQGGDGNLKKRA